MQQNLIDAFSQIVGAEHVLTGKEDLLHYAYDTTPGLSQIPDAVIAPATTVEVSKVLVIANTEKIPVYACGCGTNICGTTTPTTGGIILLMNRLNKILEIDTANLVATAEAGVTVADLNWEVLKSGLMYPPDPGTIDTATMGGTIAQNSGSLFGLKYGASKHYIMGLEIVLADGRILKTGGKNVKDVAGYDLTKLMTGSQGTLGIITKVIVKLMPEPETRKSVMAIFNSLDKVDTVVTTIVTAKIIPAALEIMDKTTIGAIEKYASSGLPATAEAVILIEIDGIETVVESNTAKIIEILQANDADNIIVAEAPAEQAKLWATRRAALPALAKLGSATFVEEATVPRSKALDLVRAVNEISAKYKVIIGTFGHAGDGNLYPTIVCNVQDKAGMQQVANAVGEMAATALRLGGSLSGEYGRGAGQIKYAESQSGPAGIAAMKAIKLALDPSGILNPGKLVGEG